MTRKISHLIVGALATLVSWTQAATCPPNLGTAATPSADFTINANGTVTHLQTGLIWRQCNEGQSGASCAAGTPTTMTWADALAAARSSTFAGHSDWRLPNKQELESIVEDTCHSTAANDVVFPGNSAGYTWTSTTTPETPTLAWVVNFSAGATYTYPKTDGTVSVRLVRAGQNYDRLAVDTTPPDTTVSLDSPTSSASPQTTATISFSGSDNVGVTAYECSLDSAAYSPCTSPKQLTALSVGAHTFQVKARDAAGNVDSTPASVTWVVLDGIPPDTQITTSPSDGSTNSATIEFLGTDNLPGIVFECALDDAAYTPCTSPKQLTALSIGVHTFRVKAKDAAGNVDPTPASVIWRVTHSCPLFDIDGAGGPTDAIDGVIVARYLMGIRGDSLTEGLSPLGPRNTGALVTSYIENSPNLSLDVFARATAGPTATADALVLIRWMQGVGDAALLNGVTVPVGAQNGTATAIRTALSTRCVP